MPNGLKLKYNVTKVKDGSPVYDCFVLRPDKDPAARAALRAYADATMNDDLRAELTAKSKQQIALICPRCTAPYDGHHCEYCGTSFVWVYRQENTRDCLTESNEAEVTEYNHLQYSGTSKKEERRTMSAFAETFARMASMSGYTLSDFLKRL